MDEITTDTSENENVNFQTRLDLTQLQQSIAAMKTELNTVIVGQEKMIDQLLVAFLLIFLH